jgi:hypothetical protein
MKNILTSKRCHGAVLALLLAARTSQAQRLGTEFRANTYTTNYQKLPAVAADSTGAFVVVWQSGQPGDGSSVNVFGQRYSSAAAPLGGAFRLDPFTVDAVSQSPAIASDAAGNFMVVWSTADRDGSGLGVFAQRWSSTGSPLGTTFQVNTTSLGDQYDAQIASSPTGDVVVVWEDQGNCCDGTGSNVFGQRYSSSGGAAGGEFLVNTYTTDRQVSPAVAWMAGTGFVVAWESRNQDGTYWTVSAQRYGTTGARLGDEFRVNTYTTGNQRHPRLASDASGNFVVVWSSLLQDGSNDGVYAQRYASGGQPLGGEFQVNSYTPSRQGLPDVASDPAGNLFITWYDVQRDASFTLAPYFGRFYSAGGARYGAEFPLSTYGPNPSSPRVAALSQNHFVVIWSSPLGLDDQGDTFGQRFQRCRSSDENGDGKFDVADVFYLVNALFAGGPPPVCGGDVNDDAKIDVADIFYLINFLFASGPPPA